jgi:hypothetical protein
MIDPLSLTISAGSFAVSAATAWLTLFRSGKLKMSWPTLFYFGPDGAKTGDGQGGRAKVFIRAFLYSTGKRGKLVENMFVVVSRGEASQSFNIWIYREEGKLSRGGGLHIDQDGKALDHHFLMPLETTNFSFIGGDYSLKVYAKIVGVARPRLLQEVSACLPEETAIKASRTGGGTFFDWAPDLGQYYVETRPPSTDPDISLTIGMRGKIHPRPTF